VSETLNQTEERQLLDAVKRAVDLVDGGKSPDEAIEKVARDEGYGPGKIKLLAHAYNNGRQLNQWHGTGNILDKLASFTLADPQRIINSIYHGPTEAEKKAHDAVDPDYAFPPSWLEQPSMEKRARAPLPLPSTPPLEPYQRDPMEALHRAYGSVQRAKQAADEAARLASAAEDTVRLKVANLVTYFKQASYNRIPFEHCEQACRNYFGNESLPLLEIVYKQAHLREKRASAKIPVMVQGVNLRAEPFTIIKEAIDAAGECCRLRKEATSKKETVGTVKEAQFRPFSNAEGSKPSAQMSSALTLGGTWNDRAANVFQIKSATGILTSIGEIAAGDIIGQGVHEKLKDEAEEQANADPLDDAQQQDEIGSIKKRVALDSMLANPGNPLSKLSAPDVVNAYNEIIKGNPNIADKIDKLQPLLEAKFGLGSKLAIDKMGLLDLALPAAVGASGRMLGDIPKPKNDLIEDKWLELEDPHHQNELRKIRAHTLLTQLMTDSEDPISGHDPDKVLSAYNELSAASPRVADSIHTLRPALRRKLVGNLEPFEAKELLDIEKGLAATRLPTPSTNILGQGPEKLLG
jgi:hypothetical protein